MTDSLQVTANNTARFAGGSEITKRYTDILLMLGKPPAPEQTADEVIARMKAKMQEVTGSDDKSV